MFALVEPSVFTTIIFSEIDSYAAVGAITPLAMIIFISCGSIIASHPTGLEYDIHLLHGPVVSNGVFSTCELDLEGALAALEGLGGPLAHPRSRQHGSCPAGCACPIRGRR